MEEHTPPAELNPRLAYTAADVANFLKVSDKTVYALLRSGQLKGRTLGQLRGWRIMGQSVYDYMNAPGDLD